MITDSNISTVEKGDAIAQAMRLPLHDQLGLTGAPPYDVDKIAYLAAAIECCWYVQEHMTGKPRFGDRHQLLDFAVENAPDEGLILEFGVFSGATINQIADRLPEKAIFGFDSFEGLPEDWTPGALAGHFKRDELPAVRKNVELVCRVFRCRVARIFE